MKLFEPFPPIKRTEEAWERIFDQTFNTLVGVLVGAACVLLDYSSYLSVMIAVVWGVWGGFKPRS